MSEKLNQLREDLIAGNESIKASHVQQLMKEEELTEFAASVSKRKSCCCVFSLQTGVLILCSIDFLVFVMIAFLTGMTAESFETKLTESSVGFTFVTDGICLLLFAIRLFYAFRYMKAVLIPPKMDYQYIIEFGKLKWHTKRVKKMRIHFKNYSLASNVSSVFIFMQTAVLLLVLWKD